MLVSFEVSRFEFKLDPDSFLGISNFLVGDTVRIGGANRFNPKLKFASDVRKQKYAAKFIFWRVLERRARQKLWTI